jgi:stearoyl-CoA desaturase (Delta-9 desaturase)
MSSIPPASVDAKLDNRLREAEIPADLNIPDNYVDYTLKNTKPLPPVTWNNWWKELNYLSLAILTITPSIALYGAFTTKLRRETAIFAVFYYFVTGFGWCRHPI